MENEQKNPIQETTGKLVGDSSVSLEQNTTGELNKPITTGDGSAQQGYSQPSITSPQRQRLRFVRPWKLALIIGLFLLAAGTSAAIFINRRQDPATRVKAGDFKTQRVSFADLKQVGADTGTG